MAADTDPRDWLRAEERELAKVRRRAERAQTRTRTAAIVLWIAALMIGVGVLASVLWLANRNRRRLRQLIN